VLRDLFLLGHRLQLGVRQGNGVVDKPADVQGEVAEVVVFRLAYSWLAGSVPLGQKKGEIAFSG